MRNRGLCGERRQRCPCCSTACGSSSTGVTTRPASRSSTATRHAGRTPSRPSAGSGRRARRAKRSKAPPGSGTRAGRHMVLRPTATPIHIAIARGRIAVVHNGIIENHDVLNEELLQKGHTLLVGDRHRGHRTPDRIDRCGREVLFAGGRAQGSRRSAGGFRLGMRVGRRTGRDRGGPTRISRGPRQDRRGRVRRLRYPRPARVHARHGDHGQRSDRRDQARLDPPVRLRRQRDRARGHPRRVGHGRGREGRLRGLHAQGDLRAARGGPEHDARPLQERSRCPRRSEVERGDPQEHLEDRGRRLRDVVPCGYRGQAFDRALDPDPGRARPRLGVPLSRPRARRALAGHRDRPIGRDRGHPRRGPVRQGDGRPGRRDHQRRRVLDHA